jgi:hypothetical protein
MSWYQFTRPTVQSSLDFIVVWWGWKHLDDEWGERLNSFRASGLWCPRVTCSDDSWHLACVRPVDKTPTAASHVEAQTQWSEGRLQKKKKNKNKTNLETRARRETKSRIQLEISAKKLSWFSFSEKWEFKRYYSDCRHQLKLCGDEKKLNGIHLFPLVSRQLQKYQKSK